MAGILNSVILNLAILNSAIIVFLLKLTHTCQDWFYLQNKLHDSLMMAAILNSVMLNSDTTLLDSDTLLSSLRITQKHSNSTLTLTQTNAIWLTRWCKHLEFCHLDSAIMHKTLTQSNSIWFKLIHSDWTWWWQPSRILPSWTQPFCTKKNFTWVFTQHDDGIHLELCHLGFKHLVIFSQIHSKTLSLHSDWLKLIQSDSNSFILT